MAVCKGCGAEIRWLKMPNGKPHPYEVQPTQVIRDPAGPLHGALDVGQGEGEWIRGDPLKSGEPHWNQTVTELYTSHFATCPKAQEFRKPYKRPTYSDRSRK